MLDPPHTRTHTSARAHTHTHARTPTHAHAHAQLHAVRRVYNTRHAAQHGTPTTHRAPGTALVPCPAIWCGRSGQTRQPPLRGVGAISHGASGCRLCRLDPAAGAIRFISYLAELAPAAHGHFVRCVACGLAVASRDRFTQLGVAVWVWGYSGLSSLSRGVPVRGVGVRVDRGACASACHFVTHAHTHHHHHHHVPPMA